MYIDRNRTPLSKSPTAALTKDESQSKQVTPSTTPNASVSRPAESVFQSSFLGSMFVSSS